MKRRDGKETPAQRIIQGLTELVEVLKAGGTYEDAGYRTTVYHKCPKCGRWERQLTKPDDDKPVACDCGDYPDEQ